MPPRHSAPRARSPWADLEARRHRPRHRRSSGRTRSGGCSPRSAVLPAYAADRRRRTISVEPLEAGARARSRAMSTRRTTRSAPRRDATSGWRTSRRRTSSSRTTTWSSSGARTSAGCSSGSRRRRFDVVSVRLARLRALARDLPRCPSLRGDARHRGRRARAQARGDARASSTACRCTTSSTSSSFALRRSPRRGSPWDAELNLSEHDELFLSLRSVASAARRLRTSSSSIARSCRRRTRAIRRGHRALRLALAREARRCAVAARKARCSARRTRPLPRCQAPPRSRRGASRAPARGCSESAALRADAEFRHRNRHGPASDAVP